MFPSLNIISVASGIMLIALHFLVNKEISQAKNPIEIQLNNKLVQTQNYSVSNHKYIFNSFSQTLPIVAKVKKDEFETTDEYNKRLQQAYTCFYGQLKSKGININNAYNIKINKKSTGNGGYKVSYDADKEIVTIRIEPGISLSNKYQDFLALEVESTSTTQYFQAGRGILKNI
ncbi:hypothetical protein [Sphaerospermopsis torques-reginae]|uniref:Uncharacterized protein n=1 Tax=Sphaerospermopsis torques-reginae ITEP-024 TaxID=984208 RepID=A0ABX8X5F8_9CYAN|nr:hypothetical protein [Sphaerospermopsis torques-reginae]QYX33941.1 hypothetical protein K2F26_11925 [Sphaerospermopsis torques-reginae ITEP-024]